MYVCIDDFAIRKGRTYGIIMIDAKTNRLIDLLESRDTEDVIKWLRTVDTL